MRQYKFKFEVSLAALVIALLLCIQGYIFDTVPPVKNDAVRYADYALNLVQHNVFGLTPDDGSNLVLPGNANAPLYPMFVAGIIALDKGLEESLVCIRANPDEFAACPQHYTSLVVAQYVVVWLTLLLLWLFVRLLFDHSGLAALSVLFALASTSYTSHAHQILTESFIPLGMLALQLGLLLYIRQKRTRWAMLIGLSLGFLTLTRPEYLYLALALAVVCAVLLPFFRKKNALVALLVGCTVYGMTLTPWMWRNHKQLDSWSLTGGGYAETILAHRLSYNDMSAAEWGAAFVYWFPDVGDKLAVNLLPETSYWRLVSANDGSFIDRAVPEILEPEMARRPREEIVGYWIRTEILGKPVTHTLTTLPLVWRGMFVRKYWGLLGIVAYAALLTHCLRRRQYQFVLLSLPAWFMVVLYAVISVSVPRYNVSLIALYSIGLGWVTYNFIRIRWKPDWAAIDCR